MNRYPRHCNILTKSAFSEYQAPTVALESLVICCPNQATKNPVRVRVFCRYVWLNLQITLSFMQFVFTFNKIQRGRFGTFFVI